MIVFLLLLLALLGHGYLVVAVINRLHGCPGSKKIINFLTKLCFAVFFAAPPVALWNWKLRDLTNWSNPIRDGNWLKAYVYLCAVWGVLKLAKIALGDWYRDQPDTLLDWKQEPSKFSQHLDTSEFHGSYAERMSRLPYNQALDLVVDRKKIKIPRLAESLEGLTIAHISDLHMTGRLGRGIYRSLVEQINVLEPNVIAITGDIVEKDSCVPWLSETLVHLHAKQGIYFVLGNHDYYIDPEVTKGILRDAGMNYVANAPHQTSWNDCPVVLAGNEWPWGVVTETSQIEEATRDEEALKLFLLHSPDRFGWACRQDADLALAGHTHGGQFRFPLLGPVVCPSLYGTRYACGVFRHANTVMHVSRGVSGKIPLRWNCPPEIALLELSRG